MACTFVVDAQQTTLAVAVLDVDDNGVFFVHEFLFHQEARHIAYCVFVRSSTESMNDNNEYQNGEESNTGKLDEQKRR